MGCLGVYTLLCLLGFLLLFSLAIVAGVYSDKMTQFSSLDTVREQGDQWLDVLEETIETQVLKLADKYPITWNQTQEVAGCCGWNVIDAEITTTPAADAENDATDAQDATEAPGGTEAADATDAPPVDGGRRALDETETANTEDTDNTDDTTDTAVALSAQTVTGWTNSKCCHNADVVNSVNIIGKVEFEVQGCRTNDAGDVYTCEGVVATYIKDNLVKTCVFCVVLAILQLTLAVCAFVVACPHACACCNKKKKKINTVHPTETRVEPVHNLQDTESSQMI